MKIVIQYSTKYQTPESIIGLLKRQNLNDLILEIIENKVFVALRFVITEGNKSLKSILTSIKEKNKEVMS